MTWDELESLKIEQPDERVRRKIQTIWDQVAKPIDGLGVFEKITAQIGAIQGTTQIDVEKKAVLVMCADNGIVAEGVSQSGQEVSTIVTKFMGQNQTSVGKMAGVVGADVIVTDVGLASQETLEGVRNRKVRPGTRNFLQEPAMTEEEAIAAIHVGIETVQEAVRSGYRLLGTGEMGIGNTTTSSAVATALLGCPVEKMTGRGAGLSDQGLVRKRKVIGEALEKYQLSSDGKLPGRKKALRILSCVGGLDIAALAGVCIGGALCHVPIVMDGLISNVAALLAECLVPGVRRYVIASHQSKEPAAQQIMDALGVRAVIRADLALGEGTGAVMQFALITIALSLYESETTFSEIQVEQYERFDA